VTGGHGKTGKIHNRLYSRNGKTSEMSWPRLAHEYHGSGCTLASAAAAQLALGEKVKPALTIAQAYTYQALVKGERLGKGQWIPFRKS
ncbi:MAG: hydroxymethylpyrimidine/phosphomethylpyrimidine kinase, partial [Gammaproteobacteria bacterium]